MEPESVISLFDSLWHNLEFFQKHPNPSSPSSSDQNPYHKTLENPQEIVTMPACNSKIDLQSSDSISPVSVLPEPIFPSFAVLRKEEATKTQDMSKEESMSKRSRREADKGKPHCKRLSELEFEELKGFMDLGFEFSEEDANSSLVEIIPGLQKLMKNSSEKTENHPRVDYCKSRPYMSEAWEAMEKDRKRKKKKALVKWRMAAMSNEVDMKHSLRLWAHTVASTIR